MRASTMIWAITSFAISLLSQGLAHGQNPETGKAVVYSYDSERPVEEIDVYARFVTGDELNELQKLIGVSTNTLEDESKFSRLELYLLLRVKASPKAHGVPCVVKLQLANDSKILQKLPLIEVVTLFPNELELRIVKIHSLSHSRDGTTVGLGGSLGNARDGTENDLVEKLHKEKPIFRLRSMITK